MRMTIEQERAQYALRQIKDLRQRDVAFKSRFRSYAKSLPAMIRMNGLGQAMAFCCAKGAGTSTEAEAYQTLYDLISAWMVDARQPLGGHPRLLEGLTNVGMRRYRAAQTEAMALMEWVRKFAIALLGTPPEEVAPEAQASNEEEGAEQPGGHDG